MEAIKLHLNTHFLITPQLLPAKVTLDISGNPIEGQWGS